MGKDTAESEGPKTSLGVRRSFAETWTKGQGQGEARGSLAHSVSRGT